MELPKITVSYISKSMAWGVALLAAAYSQLPYTFAPYARPVSVLDLENKASA